jgi:hypothetical protein
VRLSQRYHRTPEAFGQRHAALDIRLHA